MNDRFVGVALAISTAALCACDQERPSTSRAARTSTHAATPTSPAVTTTNKHQVAISRSEYGDAWPFTVESGTLTGTRTGQSTSSGTVLAEVTFTSGGKTYAVNGIAKATGRYAPLDDIWAADPSVPKELTLKKNFGPIIDRGLTLAEGIDQPFTAPKPPSQPIATTSDGIRCDQFELRAEFEPNGTDTLRRLRVSIETDLPDNTNLMVSVRRTFRKSASGDEYSIDYLDEKSTVAAWRESKVIELDQSKWQAKLDERRSTLQRLGESFNILDLNRSVTVSFVVPVNQSDKRFGLRNANLSGAAVETSSGLRVVRRESNLEWPVTAR